MPKIHIRAVGDNLLLEKVCEACKKPEGGFDFSPLYAPMKKSLAKADLALVTQETVFVEREEDLSTFPFFGTSPAAGDALVAAGFDAVNGATNHMMDKGAGALRFTQRYWRETHPEVLFLGQHDAPEAAFHPVYTEVGGIRLALFNFTQMLNFHPRPLGAHYLIDLLKPRYKNRIRLELVRARRRADAVLVFPHWGTEYEHRADSSQRAWSSLFAACGVDAVVGSHTHTLAPLRFYGNSRGRRMPVYYSLGNFMSGQIKLDRLLGGMADIEITKDSAGTRVTSSKLIPLIIHVEEDFSAYSVWPLADYPKELARRHYIGKLEGRDSSKAALYQFLEEIDRGRVEADRPLKREVAKVMARELLKRR